MGQDKDASLLLADQDESNNSHIKAAGDESFGTLIDLDADDGSEEGAGEGGIDFNNYSDEQIIAYAQQKIHKSNSNNNGDFSDTNPFTNSSTNEGEINLILSYKKRWK